MKDTNSKEKNSNNNDKFFLLHKVIHNNDSLFNYIECWNEFRRRETKWLKMLEHWDDYMMKNYKKIRDRCRKVKI